MDIQFLLDLGAALVMGVLIGLERQYRQHPAGLRTNALVCVGSALFVLLPRLLSPPIAPEHVAGQIIVGVGFLGGGVILREGLNVKGLNTAATLWCSAAVGALAGAGLPLYGAVGTLVILLMHLLLRPVSLWMDAHTRKSLDVETSYRLRIVCQSGQEPVVRAVLMRHVGDHAGLVLQGITTRDAETHGQAEVTADVFSSTRNDHAMEELTGRLNIEPYVTSVHWEQRR